MAEVIPNDSHFNSRHSGRLSIPMSKEKHLTKRTPWWTEVSQIFLLYPGNVFPFGRLGKDVQTVISHSLAAR